MTIGFADPGYNWAFVWWMSGLFLLGTVLMFLPFWITQDERKIAMWPLPGFLLLLTAPMALGPWSTIDYDTRVFEVKISQLADAGFENVSLIGDRFTAATEDGQYFEGVLVDLRPGSGYAYRVLELTETGD